MEQTKLAELGFISEKIETEKPKKTSVWLFPDEIPYNGLKMQYIDEGYMLSRDQKRKLPVYVFNYFDDPKFVLQGKLKNSEKLEKGRAFLLTTDGIKVIVN